VTAGRERLAGQPAYRWLLLGTSVNSLGNAISPVALAFAVLGIGGSATELGLVVAAYALADLAATVSGGVLGDRLRRTTMMWSANLGAGLVQAVVALALLQGWADVALLAAAGAVIGALGSLASPSTNAITRQTVPTGLLRRAITTRRISQMTGAVVGSGAGGVLVGLVEPGGALAVDAATFLVASFSFSRIDVPPVEASDDARTGFLAEAKEGLREVLRHSWLWSLIVMAFAYHLFFGGAQGVLGPVVVGGRLGAAAWGYALSAMMIGFVAGGLVCLAWRPRRILLAGEIGLVLTICFPLAIALSDRVDVLLLGAFLHGFGLEIFSVGWELAIQENVPERMLARVYSFDQLGSFLARPLGLALTGPMAALVGDRTWLLVVAGAMLVAEVVPFVVPDVRRLERHHAQ
jgi:MFS family permease